MKKEKDVYAVSAVEITKQQPYDWLDVKSYEYKLYADATQEKHTYLKFFQIGEFMVGKHIPAKLTIYEKAAAQVKQNAAKAAADLRDAMANVADLTIGVAGEMKGDVEKTVKQTAEVAVGLLGKIKTYTKDRIKKSSNLQKENSDESSQH